MQEACAAATAAAAATATITNNVLKIFFVNNPPLQFFKIEKVVFKMIRSMDLLSMLPLLTPTADITNHSFSLSVDSTQSLFHFW